MAGKPVSKYDLEKTDLLEVDGGLTRRLGLKIGRVTAVDTDNNTMNLEWMWPQGGGANNVEIGAPYVGPRSGIRFAPEIGSILVIGYSKDKIVPLSYILPADFASLLAGEKDKQGDRTFIKPLNPGDVNLRSSRGAEISLEDQIFLGDKKGNSISINPNTGDIYTSSLNWNIDNEAGSIRMGQVLRSTREGLKPVTNDGKDITELDGGNVLNELNIKVKEFSDGTIFGTNASNAVLADITVGTLVDNSGKKLINQEGNQIVCDIKFSSGARIQVDKKGKININEGNMLKPTDTQPTPDNLENAQSIYGYQNISQQRAAREGDRVTVPIMQTIPNLEHPQLINKAASNLPQMQQMAAMFLSPIGPCIFIPGGDIKLNAEITQGADGVFIGSLDKDKELEEINKNI